MKPFQHTVPTNQSVPGWAPDVIQLRPRVVAAADDLSSTLVVTGYPAEVAPGWLEPLLSYPGRLDVCLHIEPVPSALAASRLRRQRSRLEARRRTAYRDGRLDDPELEAAAEDATELAHRVARGEGRLFHASLYLTVHATTEDELATALAEIKARAAGLLLRTQPATFRALEAWLSNLPLGLDQLGARHTFDTESLAAAFPFTSTDLPAPERGGVLYGLGSGGTSAVIWDRWAQDNHNSITLARSGAGKSYLTKLEVLRSLYDGVQVFVIDPEDEYTALARAVGGTVVPVGADHVRLNPFDLPPEADGDALTRQALFLHTLLDTLIGPLGAAEKATLDTAILVAYRHAGITGDPATWLRPAPLLADLADQLRARDVPGPALAERLAPFVTGTHNRLFAAPTTHRPDGHLVVYSLRDLPEELKAVGTLLTLDSIWRHVTDPRRRRRRLVVVDEAWLLMAHGDGARFLQRMAKAARKHRAGLAVVTQDAGDVLDSPLGQAVIHNAATQILLRQAPQAADRIAESFQLTSGERAYLLSCAQGEGLLIAGRERTCFRSLASRTEDALCRTGLTAPSPDSHDHPETSR